MLRRVSACLAVAVVLFVCVSSRTTRASAQDTLTAEELFARNLQAKGGLEKWKAIETLKQTAVADAQGAKADLTTYAKRPNLQRQEVSIQGQLLVNAFDGTTAWALSPQYGPDPIQITGLQMQMIKDQSDFDGPLVTYKEKGGTLELVGRETADGVAVYHLKLTRRNAAAPGSADMVDHIYLDATTFLEAKVASDVNMGGMAMKIETEFGDYRPVEGMVMPFAITNRSNGVISQSVKVQTIQFNVKLDDALFRLPVK